MPLDSRICRAGVGKRAEGREACGSCALIFDEAERHLRRRAAASIADWARHPGSAAAASVVAFPWHMGMGLADPAASETAFAISHYQSCSFVVISLRSDRLGHAGPARNDGISNATA